MDGIIVLGVIAVRRVFVFFVFCILLLVPFSVWAHPGRTDSSGCHTCRTNCASWGLSDGEYHCHNGNSSGSSNSSSSSRSSTYSRQNVYVKSDNANLGSLKVDGVDVSISDTMNFTTSNAMPNIVGTPEHNKARVTIDRPNQLSRGSGNEITITVTAENSTVKRYKLFITLVSNDATLKGLKIGKKDVVINDEMSFVTTDSKLKLKAITNDEKASVVSDDSYKLNIGDNKVVVKVLAEDGVTFKEYILNVKRKVILSDDVGIDVVVNGQRVKFNDYKSEVIYIPFDVGKLDIKYKLSDDKASTNLKYDKKISAGDKVIKFKVTAENGDKQGYILKLHRYSVFEQIIYSVLGFALIGGVGFGIYKLFKRFKSGKK